MVSALDSGSNSPISSPGRRTLCYVLGLETLLSVPRLHPCVQMGTGIFSAGVTLRWTSIPSRESRDVLSRFMIQKAGKAPVWLATWLVYMQTSPLWVNDAILNFISLNFIFLE